MRKHRIERNLAFPTEEFRTRVRTAAKEQGFRSEQAFILAACENEFKRVESVEATTQLEARVAATLANVSKELQSLFTLAHTQFALTNSLLQYVLTCMVEPPEDILPAARARAKSSLHKDSSPRSTGGSDSKQSDSGGGTQPWQTTMKEGPSGYGRGDRKQVQTMIPGDTWER